MHFQQLTGPVMAKSVEDTAFYRYVRLVSLNEVGGEPQHFGTSPAAFHRVVQQTAALSPARHAGDRHPRPQARRGRARPPPCAERAAARSGAGGCAASRCSTAPSGRRGRRPAGAEPQRRVPALPDPARRLAVRDRRPRRRGPRRLRRAHRRLHDQGERARPSRRPAGPRPMRPTRRASSSSCAASSTR